MKQLQETMTILNDAKTYNQSPSKQYCINVLQNVLTYHYMWRLWLSVSLVAYHPGDRVSFPPGEQSNITELMLVMSAALRVARLVDFP